MTFLIITCSKCGKLFLAKADQKTRTCPYCSSKVIVYKAKKVASVADAYEASALLRKLKST